MLRYCTKASLNHIPRRYQSVASGVWQDFSKRAESLKISSSDIRNGIFNPINPYRGPASIANEEARMKYHSPLEIDETFTLAYNYLQSESEEVYKKIESLSEEAKAEALFQLQVDAEITNPEVLYISEFLDQEIDRSQPVYRQILEKKWRSYSLMLTMQRLEQLHVLPDTLPTFIPTADVQIKFSHNTDTKFSDWIVPGEIVQNKSVSKPPTIKIDNFVPESTNKYTVLLVNPDTPDLENNSFTTTLHWGLSNVELSFVNNTVNASTLLKNDLITFKDFLPLTPEKNAPTQRGCLWVFTQAENKNINVEEISRDSFDIRAFSEQHGLTPVGAHVWRQNFDTTTNEVRELYGLGKGRVFDKIRKDHLIKQ